MRISDCSSDVCSSDLTEQAFEALAHERLDLLGIALLIGIDLLARLRFGQQRVEHRIDQSRDRVFGAHQQAELLAAGLQESLDQAIDALVDIGTQLVKRPLDRKRLGSGKGGSGRGDLGWWCSIKKK